MAFVQTTILHRIAGIYNGYDHETISATAAAVGFTASKYNPADAAHAQSVLVTIEEEAIRYRYDGGDPTTSVGHGLNPGGFVTVVGKTNIENFRAIAKSGTAKLITTYER